MGNLLWPYALALMLLYGWHGSAAAAVPQAAAPAAVADTAVSIVPGATLSISVDGEAELSGNYTVDSSGNIQLSISDEEGNNRQQWSVFVADKTAGEATAAVVSSLKKYLLAPKVHLVIASVPGIHIDVVSVATRKSGSVLLPEHSHLSDAIGLVGYTDRADLAHVRILRIVPGPPPAAHGAQPAPGQAAPGAATRQPGPRATAPDGAVSQPGTTTASLLPPPAPQPERAVMLVDYSAYQRGQSNVDPELRDGDRIIIERLPDTPSGPTPFPIVRVEGEVGREISLPWAKGMTVKDALQAAGGVSPTANREKIGLYRTVNGSVQETDLNYDELEAGHVDNQSLQAGDLIRVDRLDRSQQFAVAGEVLHPMSFAWRPGEKITVSKAIEQAGGLKKDGDTRGVLRKGYLVDVTKSRDLPFDLKQVAKGKQNDMPVDPGDVILIPPKQKRPSIWMQVLSVAVHFLPFGL